MSSPTRTAHPHRRGWRAAAFTVAMTMACGSVALVGPAANATSSSVSAVSATGTATSTVSANPRAYGPVEFQTTVLDADGLPATGTVDFYVGARWEGNRLVGSAPLDAQGVATYSYVPTSTGQYELSANYLGSATVNPIFGWAVDYTVGRMPTTTSITLPSAPPHYGEPVPLTFQVLPTMGSVAMPGSVLVYVDNAQTGHPLVDGAVTLDVAGLLPGTHTVYAEYPAVAGTEASSSQTHTFTIERARTQTTIKADATSVAVGEAFVLSAEVTSAHTNPSGMVSFSLDGEEVGVVALSGTTATVPPFTLPVDDYVLTATYTGDSMSGISTSAPLTLSVGKRASTTTVTSSVSAPTFGQNIIATAKVTVSGVPASGTVDFLDNGRVIGSAVLGATGTASLPIPKPAQGSHSLTTRYRGTASVAESTSAPTIVTVGLAPVSVTLSRVIPVAKPGSLATATAKVCSKTAAAGAPRGYVTFMIGATKVVGKSDVATATCRSYVATFRIPAVGTWKTSAVYTASTPYAGATSSVLPLTVKPWQTTGTGKLSAARVVAGKKATLTVDLSAYGTAAKPSGTVVLVINGKNTAVKAKLVSGKAVLTVPTSAAGTYRVQATFVPASSAYSVFTTRTTTLTVVK